MNGQSQQQSGAPQNESGLHNVYYQHDHNLRNPRHDVLFHQLHGHPNQTGQSPYGNQVHSSPNIILHGLNDPNLYRPIINTRYYNIQSLYFLQQNLRPYADVYYHSLNPRYANSCTYMISQQFSYHYNRNRYMNAPYLSYQNNQNHHVAQLSFFNRFLYSSPQGNHVINTEHLRHFYSVLFYHMHNLKTSDKKIQQNVAKPHLSNDKLYLTFGTEFMYCRSHRNYSSDSRIWARNAYETCYFSKLTFDERSQRANTPNANNPFSDQVKLNKWIPVDLSLLMEENNDPIPKSKPSATTTDEGHLSTRDASVNANNRDASPKHTAATSKNCSTQTKANNSTSSTSRPIPSQQKNEKKRSPKREKQYEDYELPIPEIDPADYEGREPPDPLDLLEIVLQNRISSMVGSCLK